MLKRLDMDTLRFKILALITIIATVLLTKQLLVKKNQIRLGPPNVVLISVDTLRQDHIGTYGYKTNTTPNIDKWAKKAIVFNNAFTIFPETHQSFYSLFTGSDDFLTREFKIQREVIKNPEAIEKEVLAEKLKNKEYKTTAFVTNPVLGSIFPKFFQRGFSEFNYINESKSKKDNDSYAYDFENGEKVAKEAVSWLNKNKKDKFFLWLHYTTPHMPYNPPIKYLCMIDKNCKDKEYEKLLKENTPFSTYLKSCTQDETEKSIVEKSINLYDAEILSVDEQLGKVFREIDKLGLDKNTIVVFYADHGEGFDHRIFGHSAALYDSSIRIPFIIRTPGQNERKVITKYIQNSDLKTIILNLISKSSSNDLYKSWDKENDYLFAKTTLRESNKQTVFNEKYKYILSISDKCLYNRHKEELYDISKDPNEKINIINEYPDVKEQMRKLLQNKINNAMQTNNIEINGTVEKLKSLGY